MLSSQFLANYNVSPLMSLWDRFSTIKYCLLHNYQRTMHSRLCKKIFVTKLFLPFYSSFNSKSIYSNNSWIDCVFDSDKLFSFLQLKYFFDGWCAPNNTEYQLSENNKQCSALSILVLPAWSFRHEIISRLTVEYSVTDPIQSSDGTLVLKKTS